MIPYKLFGRYLDVVCDYRRAGFRYVADKTPENDKLLTIAAWEEINVADKIGWPWKASLEQLREYERLSWWTDEEDMGRN